MRQINACYIPHLLEVVITFCSIYPPSGKLSHLINPKGETGRCTTVSLNPSLSFLSPLPSCPCSLLLGLYKQPRAQCHPSLSKHKGGFYQYVLVTFRGQCCCSWTLSAGPQKSCSVSEGHYVCLLWVLACREECQVLGQMCVRVFMFMWSVLTWASFRDFYLKITKTTWHLCLLYFFWRCWKPCRLETYDTVPYLYVMSHAVFTGFTRTRCPIVNLESRLCSIVIEVAL